MPKPVSNRPVPDRAFPRKNLFLMATLTAARSKQEVKVRNLSASGALIEAPGLPMIGTQVQLKRGNLQAEATVVWSADRRGDVQFALPINVPDWIPGASFPDQNEVDRVIREARSGHPATPQIQVRQHMPSEIELGLLQRTADELAFVSRKLEAVGSDFANEPQIVSRHLMKLQELEVAGQILGHLARLLVSQNPDEVLKSIDMAELRRRLERKLRL